MMKREIRLIAVTLAACPVLFAKVTTLQAQTVDPHGWIGTETVQTRFGDFEFRNGYPTARTADKLYALRAFNRSVEAYLTHIPAVSMFYLRKGLNDIGADAANRFVISEKLIDANSLFLTPSAETVYGTSFLDLKRDGPVVVEVPPMTYGGADDMWMRDIGEFGPAGPDKGKGGKFLYLPPGYTGDVPAGYFVVRSPTFGVRLAVRGLVFDGKPERTVVLMKRTRIYPLAHAADPPAMVYLNASGKPLDTIFPETYDFFESLAAIVAQEPSDAIPPSDRFTLASIGIEKGRPFDPDAKMKLLLMEAARVAAAMARVNTFASRNPARLVYPDRHWEWALLGGSPTWDAQAFIDSDQRAAWSYAATTNSSAMVDKIVDGGSQSMWTPRDASGAFLDGGKSYRLHLPPNVPVKLFWSIIVYDALSRSELQNGEKFPGLSQYTGPVANADGSTDIYFGPQGLQAKQKNWIRTVPGKGWFTWMRFYGPTPAFFDKTWKPDDIVELR